MCLIIEWLAIWLVTLIIAYPFLFQNSNAQMEQYYINTTLLRTAELRLHPQASNSPVNIYEKVFDKYGTIKQATLLYCIIDCQDEKSWNNTTMRLINGIPSNGTYLGTILPQKYNSTVRYDTVIKDDLGYTNRISYPYRSYVYYVSDIPYTLSNVQGTPDQSAHIFLIDYNNNIKNVTLNYMVTPLPAAQTMSAVSAAQMMSAVSAAQMGGVPDYLMKFVLNYMITSASSKVPAVAAAQRHVTMKLVASINYQSRVYEKTIPPFKGSKIVWFYSTITDIKGKKWNVNLFFYKSPIQLVHYPPIQWKTTISRVDINNQTADIKFLFDDPSVNASPHGYILTASPLGYSLYRCGTICVGIDRIESNVVKDKVLIPLKSAVDSGILGDIGVYTLPASMSFQLEGNASEFPFDHYSLNLRLVIPYNPQNIEYSNHYNESVNSSLVPSFNESIIKQDINCMPFVPGPPGLILSQVGSSYCDMDPSIINDEKPSLWLIHFDFKRNYTVDAITIPILAIFYLLGAIFILESTTDQLTIRLAITLGIFAFLFTLTPIIKDMEPPATVSKVPTIADSLVTVILVATIAFSVSSVISGSPVIRNKFPRGSIWIDRIVFFFVSGLIIWYFRNYSLDITIWVVPVIIFGLGYGLLLRTSGLKIAEGLENVFKKGV